MLSEPENRPHNAKLLRNELFAACKSWLSVSIGTKFIGFALGVTSIWFSLFPDKAPYLLGFLMICAELAMWKSDRLRATAEVLHRKLDFENSFGWRITNAEISDILARTSSDLDRLSTDKETGSNFFASKHEPGSLRGAANLQESAWWSKHLAESMWIIYFLIMVTLVGSSIILLVASLNMVTNALVLSQVGRVITAVILLIFSLGLFRFTLGYYSFARSADRIEEATKVLVSHPPVEEIAVLKLWQDYQLARASGPIIPTWIWKMREKKLNKLWMDYRA